MRDKICFRIYPEIFNICQLEGLIGTATMYIYIFMHSHLTGVNTTVQIKTRISHCQADAVYIPSNLELKM